jgi:PAS domain S-box-containing protein
MENNALSPASQRYARPGTGSQPDYARAYAALASMADAVYGVDRAGCFTFVNTAFEAMTGYALADLRGTPATRLYVPEAEALFTERRRQVYSGAAVSPYLETVLLLKDGSQLPVELSVSNLIIEGQIA